ncbi:MAG: hypothetical protein U0556_03575 [Dehalococcoidia bacterium]
MPFDPIALLLSPAFWLLTAFLLLMPGVAFLGGVIAWLILAWGWETVAAVALATLVFGMFRNTLIRLMTKMHALVASPFSIAYRGLRQFTGHLDKWVAVSADAMRTYGGQLRSGVRPAPLLFEIIAPLLYALVWLCLSVSDFALAILTFSAMFQVGTGEVPLPLPTELAGGATLMAIVTLFGLVFFDMVGLVPNRLPWELLSERHGRMVRIICWIGIGLTVVLVALFVIWRPMQLEPVVPEPHSTIVKYTFFGLFAVLLTLATALSSWAVVVSLAAFYTIALLVLRVGVYVAQGVFVVVVEAIRLLSQVSYATIDVVATPWMTTKTWVASYRPIANWLHIARFNPVDLDEISSDLEQPLFSALPPVAGTPPPSTEVAERLERERLLYDAPVLEFAPPPAATNGYHDRESVPTA